MKPINKKAKMLAGLTLRIVLAVTILGLLSVGVCAQTNDPRKATPTPTPTPLTPAVTDLRGISVGMSAKEVKDKLGTPKVSDKSGMYYEFTKRESVQIGLNSESKVRTIANIFTDGDSNAPAFEDVFGPNVPLVKRKDGSIYKLIRYPKAGYWVAYSRTAGKKPMTVVTIRRINKP